ncbi:MAG: hypothetical protein HQL79_05100 [Magnetococcales bacterium]|nr:hypothetical protein [Magnetococcales bacterium]
MTDRWIHCPEQPARAHFSDFYSSRSETNESQGWQAATIKSIEIKLFTALTIFGVSLSCLMAEGLWPRM